MGRVRLFLYFSRCHRGHTTWLALRRFYPARRQAPGARAASRSSQRFHRWIEEHHLFGNLLKTCRSGYLSRRTKLVASLTMTVSLAFAIHHINNGYLLLLTIGGLGLGLGLGCGAFWIWSRPESNG
ncbi:DUF454 family protein [Microbulbifer sp. 2304DJ12-6]|uniref:DUF454 family protein n=1 Tax=Microbulbifer sp. 2304DJ12-6 TaxID=3233340 RepID=UPI0039AEC73D